MAHVIPYDRFRTLRACRRIDAVSREILADLDAMRENAKATRDSLEQAGRHLETALDQYARARRVLERSSVHHRRVMKEVDRIMETSPVFRSLQ